MILRCGGGYTSRAWLYFIKYGVCTGGLYEEQHEIMTNGPVQATFTVYEDFNAYSKGIYMV
ncbi:hypothetical protein ANCDUO_18815 [Ancylostoma duodenale]|uniref:Peptidase C1A papain C-terminal domain-containing protein n=1 Tax=Ancylostoma duodenale TaxID=51022 RepID=A0A0C2G217_9BILA|nr:hypothetical protein ANCDUO_18815 [Ancylostoma duodenale]